VRGPLLVAGGALDPHNLAVIGAARRAGVEVLTCLVGPEGSPRLRFDVPPSELWLDGRVVAPAALWLRHDVFHGLADNRLEVHQRAAAWFDAVVGWASLSPALRWMNRAAIQARVNKVSQLALARAHGFEIPRTVVSNEREWLLADVDGRVAKPVGGGGYCVPLEDALSAVEGAAAPQPAFVQERLVGPEVRAYVVGEAVWSWEIVTEALDHRTDPRCPVRAVALAPEVQTRLVGLARALGLDFAAADFKRRPGEAEPVFLEINSQPMWTAYDAACGGALADAIVAWLTR
jgi:hypothetical protein